MLLAGVFVLLAAIIVAPYIWVSHLKVSASTKGKYQLLAIALPLLAITILIGLLITYLPSQGQLP